MALVIRLVRQPIGKRFAADPGWSPDISGSFSDAQRIARLASRGVHHGEQSFGHFRRKILSNVGLHFFRRGQFPSIDFP